MIWEEDVTAVEELEDEKRDKDALGTSWRRRTWYMADTAYRTLPTYLRPRQTMSLARGWRSLGQEH